MGIRKWHRGKLLILWSWGAVITAVLLFVVISLPPEEFVIGSALLLLIVGILAGLSALTWRWLSGKEEP